MSCNLIQIVGALQAAYGKSALLGPGDRLHLDYNSTLCDFGSGDWTVEFFVNFLGNGLTANQVIFGLGKNTGTQYTPYLQIYYNTRRFIAEEANTSAVLWSLATPTFTLTADPWYHVAVVRRSNNIYIYLNGVLQANLAYAAAHQTGMQLDIGSLFYKGSYITPFQGLVNNLRVTKSAVYTANFTRPSQDLAVLPQTVLLTGQSAGNSIVDNSTYHWPITAVNTAKVDTRTPFV